jgi:2-oxoisovalerate dehydrogenase E2 component (dihydrolipoyl transacylase)
MADIKDFKLPDLGEGLEEGDIVEWHVAVGDVIELNQSVADIETAKAVVAVPSPFAGKVVELIGEVGETIEVGSVFIRIDVDVEGGEVADDAGDAAGAVLAEGDAPTPEPGDDGASVAASSWDAEDEPQPLVGYGQGKAGGGRRRRRGGRSGARRDGRGRRAGRDPAPREAPGAQAREGPRRSNWRRSRPRSGPDGIITREDVTGCGEEAAADGRRPRFSDGSHRDRWDPAPEPYHPQRRPSRPSADAAAGAAADAGRRGGACAVASGVVTPGEVEAIRWHPQADRREDGGLATSDPGRDLFARRRCHRDVGAQEAA